MESRIFSKDTFNYFPKGCCGDASCLFVEFLCSKGINSIYVWGEDNTELTHAWLVVKNNRVAVPALQFLMKAISKMKELSQGGSRIAIIHNGSSLFTGDAGSCPSDIRKYILENDLLEAIVTLPNDIFYDTGIATYIGVL